MNSTGPLVLAVSFLLSGQMALAQDISRYRVYALESSVDSVVAASGARPADAKTLHERPAAIRELQWRAPYVSSTAVVADPVREIGFTFYNDALYKVVVTYDRHRTEGLTNKDLLDALSVMYGVPVAPSKAPTSPPVEAPYDSAVIARWESAESRVTLIRGSYAADFQLIVLSKRLDLQAKNAIREAIRLDAVEAPRREAEQRKKEMGDASAARDKTRVANKSAFRP